ncbi:MAG: 30S ribosomal protein S18 [Elusimicrobia bacterium]|nr:30S ribosomal protein S18 [Elusimicrobiota bacterium]
MSTPQTPINPGAPSAPKSAEKPAAPAGSVTAPAGNVSGERPAGERPPFHSGPGHFHRGGPRPAGGGRPFPGGRGRRPAPRRKVCRFCMEKILEVDYKATPILRSFITPRGKILSGRTTGVCAKHQRQLTSAIKRAQNIALLPFTEE